MKVVQLLPKNCWGFGPRQEFPLNQTTSLKKIMKHQQKSSLKKKNFWGSIHSLLTLMICFSKDFSRQTFLIAQREKLEIPHLECTDHATQMSTSKKAVNIVSSDVASSLDHAKVSNCICCQGTGPWSISACIEERINEATSRNSCTPH